jgi:hypothetical protein
MEPADESVYASAGDGIVGGQWGYGHSSDVKLERTETRDLGDFACSSRLDILSANTLANIPTSVGKVVSLYGTQARQLRDLRRWVPYLNDQLNQLIVPAIDYSEEDPDYAACSFAMDRRSSNVAESFKRDMQLAMVDRSQNVIKSFQLDTQLQSAKASLVQVLHAVAMLALALEKTPRSWNWMVPGVCLSVIVENADCARVNFMMPGVCRSFRHALSRPPIQRRPWFECLRTGYHDHCTMHVCCLCPRTPSYSPPSSPRGPNDDPQLVDYEPEL